MGISSTYQLKLLKKQFGAVDFTPETTLYAALFISGTEVSGDNYSRVAITNNTTNFVTSGDDVVNGTVINFPQVSAAKNSINSVRFYDSLSTGVEIGRSADFTPTNVPSGGVFHIPAASLTISLT